MSANPVRKSNFEQVAAIVAAAGGKVVGRTRLQKLAYLLELSGLGDGFSFEYRHYGPYSEELASAARAASLLGFLEEEERSTSWGGFYSIFTLTSGFPAEHNEARQKLARFAADADSVELELAATAAFLADQGEKDPWTETERRKPEKTSGGRLERAKKLLADMRAISTPRALPDI